MITGNLASVVLWMIGVLLSFTTMAVSVRGLGGTLSVMEIMAVRSGFGLIVLTSILVMRPELRPAITLRRIGTHTIRNTLHFGAQYCWSWGLLLLPLATVFALEFTMPAWTTLLAVMLLGERLAVSRIGAVVLGLLGVLVVLRPGIEAFDPAALLVLAAALGYAASTIATKRLITTETTFAIIFWMNLMQLPMAFIGGADPAFPNKLELHHLLAVLGVGIAGLSSHFCLTNALRAGDASVVIPLDFMRVPLIAAVGWLVYKEIFDPFVLLGAALIVSGVLWNLRAESRRNLRTLGLAEPG